MWLGDDEEDVVEVAMVTDEGELRVLRISPDAVPAARERGWMVFADFEKGPFNPPKLLTAGEEDGA